MRFAWVLSLLLLPASAVLLSGSTAATVPTAGVQLKVPVPLLWSKVAPDGRPVAESAMASPSGSVAWTAKVRASVSRTDCAPMASRTGAPFL